MKEQLFSNSLKSKGCQYRSVCGTQKVFKAFSQKHFSKAQERLKKKKIQFANYKNMEVVSQS